MKKEKHFYNELSLIAHVHNWDGERDRADGKKEEYDDLKGDRPSCYSEMKR